MRSHSCHIPAQTPLQKTSTIRWLLSLCSPFPVHTLLSSQNLTCILEKKVGNTVHHVFLPSLLQPLSSFDLRAETGNECIFFTPNPSIYPSTQCLPASPSQLLSILFPPLASPCSLVCCDHSIYNINCCSAFILLFIFVLKAYRHCLRLFFF